MSVDVDVDMSLEILQALDFDAQIPCDHPEHRECHVVEEYASWACKARCPDCGSSGSFNLCESGFQMMSEHGVMCPICDFRCQFTDMLEMIVPINGGGM